MKNFLLSFCILSCMACGGGSSGSSGMLIEGIVTEGANSSHSNTTHSRYPKSGQGEFIEEVMVCAVGQCSQTDSRGQWGFMVPEETKGSEVQFSFQGHGISTTTLVTIPLEANDLFIHFEHNNSQVMAHHMEVNGVRVHSPHYSSDNS